MDQYFTELGQATGKGFTLISQSIVSMRQGPHVTYLMKKVRFIVVGWDVGGGGWGWGQSTGSSGKLGTDGKVSLSRGRTTSRLILQSVFELWNMLANFVFLWKKKANSERLKRGNFSDILRCWPLIIWGAGEIEIKKIFMPFLRGKKIFDGSSPGKKFDGSCHRGSPPGPPDN